VARVRPARHRWIDVAPARHARGDRPVRPDVSRDPATLARISQVYDPLNGLILDAIIAPYQQDERDLLVEHLAALEAGSLLLLDCGYPAFWAPSRHASSVGVPASRSTPGP
jgi:hypothetical protein